MMYTCYSRKEIEENRKSYKMMCDPSHDLVKIDALMDWHFVVQKLSAYYPSQLGRPSKDPVVLVKILMIQYLEGFQSVRFTRKQVRQNATYHWFLGTPADEKVPDHSTISKFLSQRLKNEVFWEAFFTMISC